MYRPMFVSGVTMDPVNNSPIVILKEIDGDETLPIWIGLLEATAIASELEGIKFARPMTHDLLKNFLDMLGVKIKRVEVCDLKDNTYYALIHFEYMGEEMSIDARPSDALALSLRVKAPIFVADEVLRKSMQVEASEPKEKSERPQRWQDILDSLDLEDLGK